MKDNRLLDGKAVRLQVGLQNHKARRLYERLGFEVVDASDTHTHMQSLP